MAELLATAAPKGLVIVRDELAGWIAGMNTYHGAGRQFWLDPMAAAPIVWSAKAAPIRCRATTRPVYRVGMPPKTLTANRGTIAAQGWSSDRRAFRKFNARARCAARRRGAWLFGRRAPWTAAAAFFETEVLGEL